jgi:hypothetical protein
VYDVRILLHSGQSEHRRLERGRGVAHDVFISYASADKAIADAVCAELESHHIRCWIAPRDVLPGQRYAEAIMGALHGAGVFVLVFSLAANNSVQVEREVDRAVSARIPMLPIRVQDVMPSDSMEYYLAGQHWLDALTPPLEEHLERLAEAIAILLQQPGGTPGAKSKSVTRPAAASAPERTFTPPTRENPSLPPPRSPDAGIAPSGAFLSSGPEGLVELADDPDQHLMSVRKALRWTRRSDEAARLGLVDELREQPTSRNLVVLRRLTADRSSAVAAKAKAASEQMQRSLSEKIPSDVQLHAERHALAGADLSSREVTDGAPTGHKIAAESQSLRLSARTRRRARLVPAGILAAVVALALGAVIVIHPWSGSAARSPEKGTAAQPADAQMIAQAQLVDALGAKLDGVAVGYQDLVANIDRTQAKNAADVKAWKAAWRRRQAAYEKRLRAVQAYNSSAAAQGTPGHTTPPTYDSYGNLRSPGVYVPGTPGKRESLPSLPKKPAKIDAHLERQVKELRALNTRLAHLMVQLEATRITTEFQPAASALGVSKAALQKKVDLALHALSTGVRHDPSMGDVVTKDTLEKVDTVGIAKAVQSVRDALLQAAAAHGVTLTTLRWANAQK